MFHNFVLYHYVFRWLTVLRSLQRNIRAAKSLTVKCPYGEVSSRRNVVTAKRPYGELSYGEKSYGEKSRNL